jgi:hypothetical protein
MGIGLQFVKEVDSDWKKHIKKIDDLDEVSDPNRKKSSAFEDVF